MGAVVLMYHRLGLGKVAGRDVGEEFYAVSEETFRGQLAALAQSNCHVMALEALAEAGLGGRWPSRALALTFDDGNSSDYHRAFPALLEHGLTATFFVSPALVGQPGYVTWTELREMTAKGMTAGAHGLDHSPLDSLSGAPLRRHLLEARTQMERELGRAPTLLSLPGGRGGAEAIATAIELGFRIVTNSVPSRIRPNQRGPVPRYALRRGDTLESFRALVEQRPLALMKRHMRFKALSCLRRGFGNSLYTRVRGAWSGLAAGGSQS